MGSFVHTRDKIIIINGENFYDLEDFRKVEQKYALPSKYTGREYIQGKINRLFTDTNEKIIVGNWEEGDGYIKKIKKYKKEIMNKEEKHRTENAQQDINSEKINNIS